MCALTRHGDVGGRFQAALDAVVPDDASPTAEVGRARVVRCRVNRQDPRANRRKEDLDKEKKVPAKAAREARCALVRENCAEPREERGEV